MGPVLCDPQSLIKDLNPQQMEAVKYYGQALLIGAGAGSGKTRVLTRRIAWLLAHGFWASSILAITFTNKAAAEMRERLAALVGPEAEHMWISTFHSACVRILRRDGKEIGLTSGFSIYDTADCERLVKLISGDLNIDTKRYTPRMLLGKISDCKNSLISWQDQLKSVNCDYKPGQRGYQVSAGDVDELVAVMYAEYQYRLAMANAVDFDDLIMRTVELFQRCPQVSEYYRHKFRYIFVDEYQDVSALQEAILNALKRGEGQTYFYVGDVKQSIYRFRLAEPGLFLGKLQRFSPREDAPCRRVVLNLNFRSRTGVLDAVNRVFSHVMDRRVTEIDYDADARLYPGVPSEGDPATELHVLNAQGRRPQDMILAEAELIARDILATVGEPVPDAQGRPGAPLHYRDIAILLPVGKNVADKVELVLGRMGIPVYCEGGGDPMTSDEVDQVLQHLTLLDNLANDVALLSELRSPLFELSERELAAIRLLRPQREASFLSALQAAAHEAGAPLDARCRAGGWPSGPPPWGKPLRISGLGGGRRCAGRAGGRAVLCAQHAAGRIPVEFSQAQRTLCTLRRTAWRKAAAGKSAHALSPGRRL